MCLSSGQGGLERYAASLVRELGIRGHRVLSVARPDTYFATHLPTVPDLLLRPTRYWPIAGLGRLVRLLRRYQVDIIHIHRSGDLPLAALAKALGDREVTLVYSRHMAVTRNRQRSPVHRWLHSQVNWMPAITERLVTEIHNNLPISPARASVLYLGVSPSTAKADCTPYRQTYPGLLLGCFSRLEPAKGQHELIEAAGLLAKQGIRINLCFMGPVMDPNYRDHLLQRADTLGIQEQVRLFAPRDDVMGIMACMDAVAMPSRNETFGLVLAEAMYMGIAVIGTAAGGVAEIIDHGQTGLTYPPGDTIALAALLRRLAEEPALRSDLARRGQASARVRFSLDRHIAEFIRGCETAMNARYLR